ncbi:MAG: hypothetical protein J5616_04570 [Bacteroidaceae bacterium]|nr:hypothetical protein [Bacteroidaceae bacterium]
MRKIAFFLTLMLMLTTCCNRQSQHERVLIDIDSLTEVDADSARRMLMSMKEEMKSANEDAQTYYDLLRVKANDKAHHAHTSDSLITSVVERLEKHDKNNHLPEAYYYVGRVNADMQNGEKAILYFHKALLADSLNEVSRLKIRCYAQIGYIYLRNGLFEEALDMQQLAYFYSKEMNDTLAMRYCTEDMQTIKELQDDSTLTTMPKTEMMVRIQKLHTQVRNQALNSQNSRLEAENSKERLMIWLVSIAAVLIIAATILVLRRQRKLRKEDAAQLFLASQSKRQFYDKDIDQLLTNHIYKNKVLKETDWKQMEERLLEAFPSFRERLFALYPLSDTEYRICMLIKMEVAPSNIAKLMALGTSAVSQNRLRMQQKVFDGKGTAKDWDKFILSL